VEMQSTLLWIWCERSHSPFYDSFWLTKSYCWSICSTMWWTYHSSWKNDNDMFGVGASN
jgi:hypothetical protein